MPLMESASPLWLYALLVAGIIVLPGMDMAFVAASSLSGGLRSGAAALAGIVLGGLVHMVLGLFGLGLLLQAAPVLFNTVLLAGALYVGWLGWQITRAGSLSATAASQPCAAWQPTLWRGLLTCLLNPKAYLFSVTVLPQFMTRDWSRGLSIAAITALAQVGIYGAVAWAASAGTQRFRTSRWLSRAVGLLLIGTAVLALLQGWRSLNLET
jgi:threonine/homoserine/homoserine lactone efflux protein